MPKSRRVDSLNLILIGASLSLLGVACSSEESPPSSESGGAAAITGGDDSGTGGSSSPVGGASTAGGSGPAAGGAQGLGGTGGLGPSGGGAPGVGGSGGPGPADGGAGGVSGMSQATGGSDGSGATVGSTIDDYNPDFVEFVGEDCDVAEAQDVDVATLPDLFEFFDGSRMSQVSEWACRRAELKKVIEKYVHGEKPGKPDAVTGTVSGSSISVQVEHEGKSDDFNVSINLPPGVDGPVPAIIVLGGFASLDGTILSEEGVATISYDNGAISDENSRAGVFTNIYGSGPASAQIGWAWGVSRIIDVLVAERDAGRNDVIDPTAIGVTGCSRLGKGAFTIGAFDERIALGIPQESGTAGVSAYRIVNEGHVGPNGKGTETLQAANSVNGWFGDTFQDYIGNVNVIPGDTHSLVAMHAPRGLLVLDNSRIGELGSIAQHAATAAGAEVANALGAPGTIAYHGGNADDPHNHCSFYESQAEPLRRAIRAHLTRTEEPDGKLEPQPIATADIDEWVLWDTPTLQ